MNTRSQMFLDASRVILLRLQSNATPLERGALRWMVDPSNLLDQHRAAEMGGVDVYRGSHGIALALLAGAAQLEEQWLADAAIGALVLRDEDWQSRTVASPGFYSGIGGLYYATARGVELTGDPQLVEQLDRLIARCGSTIDGDEIYDLIGGSAGLVIGLIHAPGDRHLDERMNIVRRASMHLKRSAIVSQRGAAWGHSRFNSRPLCGLAHGASGIGTALIDAAMQLGDANLVELGLSAFRYEDSYFDRTVQNWPDFRHSVLGRVTTRDDERELIEKVAGGLKLAEEERRFMTAWCHGAPGIGLARLRTIQLLERREVRDSLLAAIQGTWRTGLGDSQGNSLCHGLFGNLELVVGYRSLPNGNDPLEFAQRNFAERIMPILEADEPIPSGAFSGRPDPSLLLGDAGIAYFSLLASGFETRSVLMPGLSHGYLIDGQRSEMMRFEESEDEPISIQAHRTVRIRNADGPELLFVPASIVDQLLDIPASIQTVERYNTMAAVSRSGEPRFLMRSRLCVVGFPFDCLVRDDDRRPVLYRDREKVDAFLVGPTVYRILSSAAETISLARLVEVVCSQMSHGEADEASEATLVQINSLLRSGLLVAVPLSHLEPHVTSDPRDSS